MDLGLRKFQWSHRRVKLTVIKNSMMQWEIIILSEVSQKNKVKTMIGIQRNCLWNRNKIRDIKNKTGGCWWGDGATWNIFADVIKSRNSRWEAREGSPLELLKIAWPCRHLGFGFLVFRIVRESKMVIFTEALGNYSAFCVMLLNRACILESWYSLRTQLGEYLRQLINQVYLPSWQLWIAFSFLWRPFCP